MQQRALPLSEAEAHPIWSSLDPEARALCGCPFQDTTDVDTDPGSVAFPTLFRPREALTTMKTQGGPVGNMGELHLIQFSSLSLWKVLGIEKVLKQGCKEWNKLILIPALANSWCCLSLHSFPIFKMEVSI